MSTPMVELTEQGFNALFEAPQDSEKKQPIRCPECGSVNVWVVRTVDEIYNQMPDGSLRIDRVERESHWWYVCNRCGHVGEGWEEAD